MMGASGDAVTFEECSDCARRWVLPRTRCPRCGGGDIRQMKASGLGRVYSATTVNRAPTEAFRKLLPYRIALVDLEEGPRLMAHLSEVVEIGAPVEGRMQEIGGERIPVFHPAVLRGKTKS